MHSVIVRSPHIMKILRQILSDYPGVSPAVDHLTLDKPFEPMFHHWDDFCQAVEQSDDFTKQHVEGFVMFLKEELAPYFEVLNNADAHGIIEHQNLWTIFAPHQLVWTDLKQHHSIGEVEQASKVGSLYGRFRCIIQANRLGWFRIEGQIRRCGHPVLHWDTRHRRITGNSIFEKTRRSRH
uniref:Uncharacterized protein n=1 Tax=Bionectria ochroleuca TaxID=29856 RepID=A0A8H7N572_BIOOC